MGNLAELEKQVMRLAAEEREQLAIGAWESLGDGSDAAINEVLDPEGIKIANERDKELSSGAVKSMSHSEFLRRISNNE